MGPIQGVHDSLRRGSYMERYSHIQDHQVIEMWQWGLEPRLGVEYSSARAAENNSEFGYVSSECIQNPPHCFDITNREFWREEVINNFPCPKTRSRTGELKRG